MQKRTEITIERETVLFLEGHDRSQQWCSGCRQQVDPLTLTEAATLASVRSWSVVRWIEASRIHHGKTAAGLLWICPRSIESITEGVSL